MNINRLKSERRRRTQNRKTVIPYLIRRAEENTSVAGQTGREPGDHF